MSDWETIFCLDDIPRLAPQVSHRLRRLHAGAETPEQPGLKTCLFSQKS